MDGSIKISPVQTGDIFYTQAAAAFKRQYKGGAGQGPYAPFTGNMHSINKRATKKRSKTAAQNPYIVRPFCSRAKIRGQPCRVANAYKQPAFLCCLIK